MIKRLKKTYHGWWISLAGGLNTAISSIPTFSGGSIIFKAIEDEFNVKFKLEDIQSLKKIKDFVELLERYKIE